MHRSSRRAYYLLAMIFTLIFIGAAILAGGIASPAGFGIGSIMTPTLAAKLGTKLAVAASLAIPGSWNHRRPRYRRAETSQKIPEHIFRRIVAFIILALGMALLIHPNF